MENTPPKPKEKRYVCKYLNSWEKEAEFQGWLTRSVKGEDHAFCRLCMKNIKIDHGGKNDLMKHVLSAAHQSSKKSQNVTMPIQIFLTTSSDEGKTYHNLKNCKLHLFEIGKICTEINENVNFNKCNTHNVMRENAVK